MSKNLYLDIHVLQDVPPANLNRDDSGTPKTAIYGGVERLRVSSQAWKRATRLYFRELIEPTTLGVRTRRITELLHKTLIDGGVPDDKAVEIAPLLLAQLGIKPSKKEKNADEASYLIFFSLPQLREVAKQVVANKEIWDNPEALSKAVSLKAILGKGHSLDVAAFGRMVADLADLNVDAAVQVSHALGTHASNPQFDYFTAVDDAQSDAESGAGMIGTVEFSSGTLYRYASVSVPGLIANMGDKTAAVEGVALFLKAFIESMPSGKQNTFAAHTRPGLVLVHIRVDRPVSMMSAFEEPVTADGRGYLASSIERLNAHLGAEMTRWGDAPLHRLASYIDGLRELDALGESLTVPELISRARNAIAEAAEDV